MTRHFLSVLVFLSLWAGPACAANIPGQSAAGSSEGGIQALSGATGVLIKQTQEPVPVTAGEGLIVKTGGKTSIDVPPEQPQSQTGITNIADNIQLADLPSVIVKLRQNQEKLFSELQSQFDGLAKAAIVSPENQQAFLKNIEHLTSTLLYDQTILSGLQLKVQNAMATATPAMGGQLASYMKMIGEARTDLQKYQSESVKMAKTQFKTEPTSTPETAQLKEQVSTAWAAAEALIKEVQDNPSGLSQDFFAGGVDKLNGTLKELGDLQARLQTELAKNPADSAAQAALKQVSDYVTEIGKTLKNFTVVKIDPAAIAQMQDLNDQAAQQTLLLQKAVSALRPGECTKEQLDALFALYDKVAQLYGEGQRLYESLMRGAAGQKFKTAEQEELETTWERMADTFQQLGTNSDKLASPDRDKLWADYLKPPLALIDDVTADTLQPGNTLPPETPLVAKYLPVTPSASHSDLVALLNGAVLGDVLVKDGITYGIAVRSLGDTTIFGAGDTASIRHAQLEVFRIENGQHTSSTLGTFEVYAGAAHAAVDINSDGALTVFLNGTDLGNKDMVGEMYTMNRNTLGDIVHLAPMPFGRDQGWYPRIDENGHVLSIYVDLQGDEHTCSDLACDAAISPALAFMLGTDAFKAAHSNFTFNTAAAPDDLPADVVARRLTGETGVSALGNYDYLSWGKWNDGAGVADTIYTNSAWIAGSLTPAADIPVTGSASYSGHVVGKLSEGGDISSIGGTTALTANFSGRSLTGTFDMTKNNAAWKTANLAATWGAGTGNIAGTLATTDTAMSGAVNGNFFGPAANQVGGAWNLSNAGGVDKAAGVFTGNKQ